MKANLFVFTFLFMAQVAQAGTLILTCGQNAYEALEEKNLSRAEFVLELKTRGANNPPEVVQMIDDGASKANLISQLRYQLPNITLSMQGGHRYEITGISNCSSIETGTADIAYLRYVGGFAGHAAPIRAKCNCLDRAL